MQQINVQINLTLSPSARLDKLAVARYRIASTEGAESIGKGKTLLYLKKIPNTLVFGPGVLSS